jgi:hypothetical protein
VFAPMTTGEAIVFLLHAGIVAFSLLAAWFWMAAAWGVTIFRPEKIPQDQLPAHQSKWNSRAALCAAVAALCQGVLFMRQYWPQ